MLIENPDAFKSWLTSVLEPLCDADPEALAKYVFALVKKDKTVDVLRQGMLEQLDVFLQSETKPFVELLFKTLETQDYLMPAIPNANPPNPNVPLVLKKDTTSPALAPKSSTDLIVKEIKPIIPVSTLPNLSESINGNVAVKPKPPPLDEQPPPVPTVPIPVAVKPHRKSDSEKEEPRRAGRSTRHRSTSRNRSRSRSWERPKRSRSRERSPRRNRPWRNKSPPRRYDRERRRSRSGSPQRLRSRSRSPRHSYRSSGRYRNRSPPLSRSRSRSNERNNRLDKDKKETKVEGKEPVKEENSGGATPTQDSNHGDTDMRLTSTTQSIQSVVSALNNPGALSAATPGGDGFAKRRCRDFDEKGYCMRGEMCPYDHGVDPVVLEDTALSRVLTFGPNGAPTVVAVDGAAPGTNIPAGAPASGPNIHHHPPGMIVSGGNIPGHHHPPGTHHRASASAAEYNPSAPAMWHHRPGFRGPRNMSGPGPRLQLAPGVVGPFGGPPLPSMQRELINVQVTDNTHGNIGGAGSGGGFKRRAGPDFHHQDQLQQQQPNAKRKQGGFDFARLGPRAGITGGGGGGKNPSNCSLELKKVPRGLNNITHLNNHFSKFGKIVNIQVCFEGDPEGAIVTFSSHAEANAAYRSTEAVLNNRFIKVFWHSSTGSGENIPPMQQQPPFHMQQQQQNNMAPRPVKDRLGQPANSNNKVLNLLQPKAAAEPTEEEAAAAAASGDKAPSTVYVPSAVKRDNSVLQQQKEDSKALANAAIVKNQEILAAKEQLKKKHEEKRKEALKITQDLRKRKQELLEKQLAQQKLLIEKLEKTNPTSEQRDLLMTTIKTVQESIESIRKDMMSSTPVAPPTAASQSAATPSTAKPQGGAAPARKSKEEAQREVLDAELDLITRQQEGGDTSELQKRLLELRAQAYSLSRGGAVRRGRGALARRSQHIMHLNHHRLSKNNLVLDNGRRGKIQTVVDHRPTRILVSGYEADETDSVLAHFSQFGEITEYVSDDSTPSLVLNYRSRKEAEMALLKGKPFQDRTLSVTWCQNVQLSSQQLANSRTVVLSSNNNSITPAIDSEIAAAPLEPPLEGPTAAEQPTTDVEDIGKNNNEDKLLEGDDENVLSEPLGAELSEEALLQDDEEDDDENEDRSWRR